MEVILYVLSGLESLFPNWDFECLEVIWRNYFTFSEQFQLRSLSNFRHVTMWTQGSLFHRMYFPSTSPQIVKKGLLTGVSSCVYLLWIDKPDLFLGHYCLQSVQNIHSRGCLSLYFIKNQLLTTAHTFL